MKKVDVSSSLIYDVNDNTDMLLKVGVSNDCNQKVISELFTTNPPLELVELTDSASSNRLHRVTVRNCTRLEISYSATIELKPRLQPDSELRETAFSKLPGNIYRYLNPSRYCESDLLQQMACREFGLLKPGYSRVQAISDWVSDWISYVPGATISTTTAQQVVAGREGVCRDYAHVAIALCRGLGIPARYSSGYALNLQPPDFHGLFEAYLDGEWYLFDPSKLADVGGLVRIANGVDASETAFNTIYGFASLVSMSVSAVQS